MFNIFIKCEITIWDNLYSELGYYGYSHSSNRIYTFIFHPKNLQYFSDKMGMVAHLVGIDQLGYEKELGMTPSVS